MIRLFVASLLRSSADLLLENAALQHYLWRAVDQDGETIDILVQSR